MEKRAITGILAIILVLTMSLIFAPKIITGNIVSENENHKYSYTTAICDNENYCEDYYVECTGSEVKKLTATGFSIQHDDKWSDSRPKKEFCNLSN